MPGLGEPALPSEKLDLWGLQLLRGPKLVPTCKSCSSSPSFPFLPLFRSQGPRQHHHGQVEEFISPCQQLPSRC